MMHEKRTIETPIATYTPILVFFGVFGDVRGDSAVAEGMKKTSIRRRGADDVVKTGIARSRYIKRGGMADGRRD